MKVFRDLTPGRIRISRQQALRYQKSEDRDYQELGRVQLEALERVEKADAG